MSPADIAERAAAQKRAEQERIEAQKRQEEEARQEALRKKQEAAQQAEAERQAQKEKAELEKRLKELPAQQKKEDTEAASWLKAQQALLAKEPAKAATAQTAQQEQIARSMSPSQFDQKWCPAAGIMTIGGFPSSQVANQRQACAKQDLSAMPAIKGNCSRVEVMAGCGCYTVAQVQAEAAALGCSGYSTAALTLLPSLSPPPGSSSTSTPVPNPGLSNGVNGLLPTSPAASNTATSSQLTSAQIQFLKANSVSLTPQVVPSAAGTTSQTPSFQPSATTKFVTVSGSASSSVWQRLQNATSFADASAKNDPNFQAGVQGAEMAVGVAGVGCAVGAGVGAVAGLGVGALPGCAAGAVLASQVVGAGTLGLQAGQGLFQIGQGLLDRNKSQTIGGITGAVQLGAQSFADSPSPIGGIVPSLQVGGSWGTYFVYAFYNNVPGP